VNVSAGYVHAFFPDTSADAGKRQCRCDDPTLAELLGDEALEYGRRHLEAVSEERGAWLVRCPMTGEEWVKDFPAIRWREDLGDRPCRVRRLPRNAPGS
jgi:hypothetical protein